MLKGSIRQEDIKIPNMYTPNNTASKYVKQKLTETQEIKYPNCYSWRSQQFESINDRYKCSKKRDDLQGHCELPDIYRRRHPTTAEYIFSYKNVIQFL